MGSLVERQLDPDGVNVFGLDDSFVIESQVTEHGQVGVSGGSGDAQINVDVTIVSGVLEPPIAHLTLGKSLGLDTLGSGLSVLVVLAADVGADGTAGDKGAFSITFVGIRASTVSRSIDLGSTAVIISSQSVLSAANTSRILEAFISCCIKAPGVSAVNARAALGGDSCASGTNGQDEQNQRY